MIKFLYRLLVRCLFRLHIHGEPPRTAPERLLVISNHQSFLDGILIASHLDIDVTWVVHQQLLQKWFFRWYLSFIRHIAIDAAAPLSMKRVFQLLESGVPVGIFPEGRLTTTGGLMKIYDGTAFLAARSGASILTVRLEGLQHSFFGRLRAPFPIRKRPEVHLTFLPLQKITVPEGGSAKQRRRLAGEKMRLLMQEANVAARRPATLWESLLDAADLYGYDAPIVEDVRPKLDTYKDLLKGALALGRLLARQTARGERVGLLLPNAGPAVAALFGLWSQGRVPALLNYTAGVDGMQSAIELAQVKLLVTSRAFLEKGKLTDKVAQLKGITVVYLEDLRGQFGLWDKLWLILWALDDPRRIRSGAKPQDAAVVLFTSGSEGRPKGVVLSHDNLLTNARQVLAQVELSNRDRFMMALPMFHSFGLLAGVILPVLNGVPIFLYPSPLHYRIVPELTYDRDCTVLLGTPTFLKNYARFANPYDFYRVRYVVGGAEKLTPEIRQLYMERFGLRILEGYGATECSPLIAVNSPKAYKPDTVGQLAPCMEARLAPVDGIAEGGRLHVRGPNVMLGYFRHEKPGVLEPPKSELGPGWYDTGDLAAFDEEGFLRLLGRLKRFAKVAGEMVSLEVVERIAGQASPRFGHGAVAVKDPQRGEVLVLVSEDPNLRRDALVQAARQLGAPEVAVARRVEYVAKLPRLGSGKIDYVTLQGQVN